MSDLRIWAYRELFACRASNPGEDWPFDHDHGSDRDCDWGWLCNADGCDIRVDDGPCPEHAPIAFPGLRLVECQAEPRHWLFVHDREDYGHGCPLCWCDQTALEMAPLKAAADRRVHRWCWVLNRVKRLAIRLRLTEMWSVGGDSPCWHVDVKWRRWSR